NWWFLTYLGWARIETGDVATGSREVERALALNPQNAYAAHARAWLLRGGRSRERRRIHRGVAPRLRPQEPTALPPLMASGAVRIGMRPAGARLCALRRCDPARRVLRAAAFQSGRRGVVPVAVADLWRDAAARW